MFNQPITWQQVYVFRHVDMVAEVQTGHQNREGDLKGTLLVARLLMPDGLISQTADLLRFSQI